MIDSVPFLRSTLTSHFESVFKIKEFQRGRHEQKLA
jgi:hypothetical protein